MVSAAPRNLSKINNKISQKMKNDFYKILKRF